MQHHVKDSKILGPPKGKLSGTVLAKLAHWRKTDVRLCASSNLEESMGMICY